MSKLSVRLSDAERAKIEAAAERSGLSISDFARAKLLRAALADEDKNQVLDALAELRAEVERRATKRDIVALLRVLKLSETERLAEGGQKIVKELAERLLAGADGYQA